MPVDVTRGLWRLPWTGHWVPHGLLDIIRGCNISCRACYNSAAARAKPLDEIKADFETLRRHRKLDSLSLVGGEPTLHPQLPDIVRMIKVAGIKVELFTNGVLLDPARLAALKASGLDMMFLHIDAQQNRPDLPDRTPAGIRAQRHAKAAMVAAAGIEVGLAITAYPDAPEEIDAAVELVLPSPHLDYLLVTLCRDTLDLGHLTGSLAEGIRSETKAGDPHANQAILDNHAILERLKARFGLHPFAYIGSNVDPHDPRWLSFMAGTLIARDGTAAWSQLRPSFVERLFVSLYRRRHGHYPFYLTHAPGRFRLQLLLNAMTGGRPWGNLGLLLRSSTRKLRAKRILFQCPAELAPDGSLIHCAECPDATPHDGQLVPVCVVDQFAESLAERAE